MPDRLILHGVPVYLRHDRPPVEAIGISGSRVVAAGALAEVRTTMQTDSAERPLTGGAVLPAPHVTGAADVAGIRVLATWSAGREVYRRPG